jgi:competence protein ComGC
MCPIILMKSLMICLTIPSLITREETIAQRNTHAMSVKVCFLSLFCLLALVRQYAAFSSKVLFSQGNCDSGMFHVSLICLGSSHSLKSQYCPSF